MDIIQSVKTQSVYYIHWSISHLLLRQQQLTFNTFPSTLKFSHEKDEIKRNTTQNGFYNWPYGHVSSFLKDWIEFIEPWVSNSTNWRLFNAIISRLKVWRVWCLISFNDRLAKLEGTYVAELLYVHTSVYSFIYFFNLPCIIFLRKWGSKTLETLLKHSRNTPEIPLKHPFNTFTTSVKTLDTSLSHSLNTYITHRKHSNGYTYINTEWPCHSWTVH